MQVGRVVALSVAVCAAASSGSAQPAMGELQIGAQVRVRADKPDADIVKGTILSSTRDSLFMITSKRKIAIARRDVQQLEVKRRRTRSAGALRLATWVGAVSAVIFTPAALGTEDYDCGVDRCRAEGGDAAQIAVLALASSLYGQVIGAIWPGRRWLPVAADSLHAAGIKPPAQGARVRITAAGYTAPDFEGTVATATPDSLVILARAGSVVAVPMSALTRLEVANGRDRGAGALRGLRQAVPVAGLYLALGWQESAVTVYRNGIPQSKDTEVASALFGAAAFTAALGAGLGAAIAPRQWIEPRTSTSLLVSPDARGRAMRVGLVHRF